MHRETKISVGWMQDTVLLGLLEEALLKKGYLFHTSGIGKGREICHFGQLERPKWAKQMHLMAGKKNSGKKNCDVHTSP